MSTQPPSAEVVHPGTSRIEVYADAQTASRASAESFARHAVEAVQARGRFSVALSGGSAPEQSYRMLGDEPFRSMIPWEGVHLFWGDDRCVTPGHPRSNFRMANAAFITRVPIPPRNVHRMPGELPPREGAARYAAELEAFFGPGVPRFDLVHLGIGPDGHTASLFPFDDLLRDGERTVGWALHRPLGEWRLTFTVPVLNAARRVEMLALGAGKASIVRSALEGPIDPYRIPAQLVRPSGEMVWMVDRGAGKELAGG
ncbi:MAG TPA: 6-phosphogluconolactonase [Longimicrobium sp.]|uniref:6-phosphogluconolactonase n=1 Tax=Longimicrobium sp. TaxID=2029185 RepID=UPI002ED8FDAB